MNPTFFYLSYPGRSDIRSWQSQARGGTCLSWAVHSGAVEHYAMEEIAPAPQAYYLPAAEPPGAELARAAYEQMIVQAVTTLTREKWEKVVLSRRWKTNRHRLDPYELFQRLVAAYPAAAVYLFSDARYGTWLGATPETLLRMDEERLYTMSLAGTRSAAEKEAFSDKEKHEQAVVTDFIDRALRQTAGVYDIQQETPELVPAGEIWHLRTLFKARRKAPFEPEALLQNLHPTPAVVGWPRREALSYLRQVEGYPRQAYTGYFGLTQGDRAHYFVNLRCMQMTVQSLYLYAGGGITHLSDPAREWEETEEKMQTLKRIFDHD